MRRPQFSRMTALQEALQESPTATTVPSLSAVTPKRPAAQTSFDEIAVTASRKAPCPTLAPKTTLQFVPFQCSIKVVKELPAVCCPTAHTSLLATPSTAANFAALDGGCGDDAPITPVEVLGECRITARRAAGNFADCPDVVVRDCRSSAET